MQISSAGDITECLCLKALNLLIYQNEFFFINLKKIKMRKKYFVWGIIASIIKRHSYILSIIE